MISATNAPPPSAAPFRPRALYWFAFLGGVLGAGFAGAVSWGRMGEAGRALRLVFITLAAGFVMSIVSIVSILLILRTVMADLLLLGASGGASNAQILRGIAPLLLGSLILVVCGFVYARWIIVQQRLDDLNWRARYPLARNGCLAGLGIGIGLLLIAGLVRQTYETILWTPVSHAIYPSAPLNSGEFSLALPPGWTALAFEELNRLPDCRTSGGTCVGAGVALTNNSGQNAGTFIFAFPMDDAISDDQLELLNENALDNLPLSRIGGTNSDFSTTANGDRALLTEVNMGLNGIRLGWIVGERSVLMILLQCTGRSVWTCDGDFTAILNTVQRVEATT
jgi:hypothetical protein